MTKLKEFLKRWSSLDRGIPVSTVIVGLLVVLLSFLDILPIELSPGENIVIILIAVIAFDTLRERVTFLERLDRKIDSLLDGGSQILERGQNTIEDYIADASEITVVAGTGLGITDRHRTHFKTTVESGGRVRIVLLNPDTSFIGLYDLTDPVPSDDVISKIRVSLNNCRSLQNNQNRKGSFELRLIDTPLPFTMIGVDPGRFEGRISVEFRAFKIDYSARPSVVLTPAREPHWYQFYASQFEIIWSAAKPWNPDSAKSSDT